MRSYLRRGLAAITVTAVAFSLTPVIANAAPVTERGISSNSTLLWGLDRIDQRSGQNGQYSIGDEGAGVDVYVMDSGLNPIHTDFSGRVPATWNGVDDGNDFHDCNGHGTHVAGTIAGTNYGIAKKANIIPVRIVGCNGFGLGSALMAGIEWVVEHHVAGQPAVMNLSTIIATGDVIVDRAVQKAVDDGITVVAAAGNHKENACTISPARVPSVITVTSTDANDKHVAGAGYGSCVDVQAPGIAIGSAWAFTASAYRSLDGTSMAAPHVAGAAAVMLSRDRSLTPAQVHDLIVKNATNGVVSGNKGFTPNKLLFIPPFPVVDASRSDVSVENSWLQEQQFWADWNTKNYCSPDSISHSLSLFVEVCEPNLAEAVLGKM